MPRIVLRYLALPVAAAGLALVLGVTTRLEQERQYDALRGTFEAHARFAGHVVREAAQEATWSTGLVWSMSAENAALVLDLLGAPGASEDCAAVRAAVPDLAVWAARDAGGVRGCLDRLQADRCAAFVDHVLSATDPGLVDDPETRGLGVFCAAAPRNGGGTVACLARDHLDAMRREVGLGPLLGDLQDPALEYVVIQDAGGILAASPSPGTVTAWTEDPVPGEVLAGPGESLRGRLLDRGGRSVYEVVAPLDLADGTRAVVRTALDASELTRFRERVTHRQRVMVSVLVAAVLLSAALSLVLARASRRREEFRETLRRREEENRHWQSLGQLAATVAHEVRNPLNTIGMALQRLGREVRVDPGDEAGFRELVGLSLEASDRVERVVAEFLDLGRPLQLDPQPVPAGDLLREVLAPLALRAEADGKTLEVLAGCGGDVVVDRRRFGQIVTNLVGNALDAVAPGGRVMVETRCDGGTFQVVVVDDGPGMDAATLERVQAPFVTTKAQGTGLGLPLARRLAEAHGGTLVLASIPGTGTRVVVTLPSGR